MINSKIPSVAAFVKANTARDADAFATTALLLDESELEQLAFRESFKVGRFEPATSRFWYTDYFFV